MTSFYGERALEVARGKLARSRQRTSLRLGWQSVVARLEAEAAWEHTNAPDPFGDIAVFPDPDRRAPSPVTREAPASDDCFSMKPKVSVTMTRSELIDHLATKTYIGKAEVKRVVDGVFEAIIDAAVRGEEVAIANFGKFSVRRSAARDGRNPRTGEPTTIRASARLAFKPGKAVKDRLNA